MLMMANRNCDAASFLYEPKIPRCLYPSCEITPAQLTITEAGVEHAPRQCNDMSSLYPHDVFSR